MQPWPFINNHFEKMEIILECISDLIDSELLKSKNVSHIARKFFFALFTYISGYSLLISSLKKYILIEKVLLMLNWVLLCFLHKLLFCSTLYSLSPPGDAVLPYILIFLCFFYFCNGDAIIGWQRDNLSQFSKGDQYNAQKNHILNQKKRSNNSSNKSWNGWLLNMKLNCRSVNN